MIKLFKKNLIISLTLLLLLFGTVSTASAGYYYNSGTTTTSYLSSDLIYFYPSFDWYVYEGWVYDIYYGKNAVTDHLHEGDFNSYSYYKPYFDQSMANTLNFQYSNGSTFDSIYYWEWQSRDVMVPLGDKYWPGEKSEQVLVPIDGHFFWTWSWYIDGGIGGTTKSVYSDFTY